MRPELETIDEGEVWEKEVEVEVERRKRMGVLRTKQYPEANFFLRERRESRGRLFTMGLETIMEEEREGEGEGYFYF